MALIAAAEDLLQLATLAMVFFLVASIALL
jgi:hypothetical protein